MPFFVDLMDGLQVGKPSFLEEEGKQQIQQVEKGANNDDNHHVCV